MGVVCSTIGDLDRAYTRGQNAMIEQIRHLIHEVMVEYTPSHSDQIIKEQNAS